MSFWISAHRPSVLLEPTAARIAGRSATTHYSSVYRVALELRNQRQARQIKAPVVNSRMADGHPSAVTDFRNKVCQKRKWRDFIQ
jgi:hypothetical protein